MKWLKRLSLPLSVCVCLCVLFSHGLTASAASVGVNLNSDNYTLDSVQILPFNSTKWQSPSSFQFTTSSSNAGELLISCDPPQYWRAKFSPKASAGSLTIQPYMELNCNISYLMQAGSSYTGQTISGALYLTAPNGTVYEFPVTDQIELINDSGLLVGYHIIIGGTVDVGTGFDTGDCSVEFILSGVSNAASIRVSFYQLTFNARETITDNTVQIVDSIEQGFADLKEQQAADTQKTHGLLGSVIDAISSIGSAIWSFFRDPIAHIDGWLEVIKSALDSAVTGITGLPSKLYSAFRSMLESFDVLLSSINSAIGGLVSTVVSLPDVMWTKIEEGFTFLFIPSDEYLESYFERYETLLKENFGVLFESTTLVWDLWNNIQYADQVDTIEMPLVTIPLPENESFSFGGFTVKIVPDGFEFVATFVKLIAGLSSTILFFMGLRRAYDRIMEDES